jgi:2,3-bisphosphoglycerate-independent phosphoglycerate mutase
MASHLIDELCIETDSKIIFLILDGLGGLQMDGHPVSELEAAKTPNMDRLVAENTCGAMIPVEPGVTPGSGPGHFGLFGYDPVDANIGRGVLSAAGLEFDLTERDVAARVNLATLDANGHVQDRRAGRIATEENARICKILLENVKLPDDVEFFLKTVKEHRALFVLRGDGLGGELAGTDPQQLGVPPLSLTGSDAASQKTARYVTGFLEQAKNILKDEPHAKFLLLRGFSKHRQYKSLTERFKLKPCAIANYPMYRGISRLVGMNIAPVSQNLSTQIDELERTYNDYTFFFMHVKTTDATGEDGDYEGKVKAIEEVDALLPRITALNPDVLVITGDHSTPSAMRSHSWHPIPILLAAKTARRDRVAQFSENDCLQGGLGLFYSQHLMNFALAHAGKLMKFGA